MLYKITKYGNIVCKNIKEFGDKIFKDEGKSNKE